MELKELAKKIGAKNIIVSHINNLHYKDCITVVLNDDIVMNLTGKTFEFIPLNENGINKGISNKNAKEIFSLIRKEMENKCI